MQINIKMSDVIKTGFGLYLGWSLAKNVELIIAQSFLKHADKKENENGAA